MSTPILPPNPSLVAIILIIKTRQGVKHIFHYPPNPGQDRPHAKLDYENSSEEDTSSSDDDSYGSLESDRIQYGGGGGESLRENDDHPDESGSISPEKSHGDDWRIEADKKGKRFLGLPLGFEHFLCPPSSFHKKRFELTVNQLAFLGWPVFAKENGEWKSKRRSRSARDRTRRMSTISEQTLGDLSRRASVQINEDLEEATGNESVGEGPEHEASKTSEGLDILLEEQEEQAAKPNISHGLNMFHVVFVLNPPPLEYQLRTDEMYKHVIKKFSKALKWEQAKSNFVLRECEKMKAMKAKHDPASEQLFRSSPLAKAIATIYTFISTSRIAHINLTKHFSFSLQIPIPNSISQLPDLTSPQLPGLWLTTATTVPSNEELHATRYKLASHFTLLLLTDKSSILADISTDSPIAGPLAHYLRCTVPTKSFLQISQSSGISLDDIQFLASHLVYWRRARAIPPLHQRDVYIVSPNADMRKLKSACTQYAKLFPALPTLPKMLSLLSSSTRPYSTFIPSKDHKLAYFDILAWLMRGGWVTQLRAFGWVRVPGEVQATVAQEMQVEKELEEKVEQQKAKAQARGKESAKSHGGPDMKGSSSTDDNKSNNDDDDDDDSITTSSEVDDLSSTSEPDLPSGYLSPLHSSNYSTTSSTSSARTAIPINPSQNLSSTASTTSTTIPILRLPTINIPSPPSKPIPSPPNSSPPLFILQPTECSGIESRYLDRIARDMEAREGRDVREAWERCLKYFNGEHALEKIATREGWKRKRVEWWRGLWGKMGVLKEVRHW